MEEGGVVLRYKEVVLRRADIHVLEGPCYLNDQVIAFYFSYLSGLYDSGDVLLVPPSISFWVANSQDQNLSDFLEPLKLPTKKLVLFTVNDSTDLDLGGLGEAGTHWSCLVYNRAKNSFLHLDSMAGANDFYARKLYEALKEFMGPPIQPQKNKNKNKKKPECAASVPSASNAATPAFVEADTPQQTNGYDCGIYVIAIARSICQWFSSQRNRRSKDGNDWLSAIQTHVDASVEITMRDEILKLIQDLQED